MITSFSVSSLFKRDEFYLLSLSLFPSFLSRPESYFFYLAVSYLRFLFYSYFLFFCFVFLRNVTLALSSACRNVLCLQITRLFSTCTFLHTVIENLHFLCSHLRNHEGANLVFSYLPLDSPTNLARDEPIVRPSLLPINSSRLVLHLVLILHAHRGKQVNVNPFCMHRSSNRVLLSRE